MLLQNKSFLACNGMAYLAGGPAVNGVVSRTDAGGYLGTYRNMYVGDAGVSKKSSIPTGYSPTGGAWLPAMSAGGMAIRGAVLGAGITTHVNLAGAFRKSAVLSGTGSIINAALLQNLSASFSGSGAITPDPDIVGVGRLSSTLDGSGGLTATGEVLGWTGAVPAGEGQIVSADLRAKAQMTASVLPYTELSPQSLSAAVWNALASAYDATGTMGEKLNAAGNSGDPWITDLPGSYSGDQAGAIIGALKDPFDPDEADGVEDGMTFRQAQRLIAAATSALVSGATGGTADEWIEIMNAFANSKRRMRVLSDQYGNRKQIEYTLD